MNRILVIAGVAGISLSALVVAIAAVTTPPAHGAGVVQPEHALLLSPSQVDDMPAPQPPLDETPITPVESAGAPMYP